MFPSPPLLYEHREDTHRATEYTKGVVTHGAERERSKGDIRDGLIHSAKRKGGYRGVRVKKKPKRFRWRLNPKK